jgi:uncharacterized protein YndB with AHSA1/START domain
MTTPAATAPTTTTQVFRVHIKAAPEKVWDAITRPEWTARYGYRTASEYELKPGGRFRALANDGMKAMGTPDVVVEGEVLEVDPPRRLVQSWRMLFEESQAAEPLTRLTWEIEQMEGGVTRLTVVHELEGAPIHLALVTGDVVQGGGGWPFILSDLKSLLETGSAMGDGD